MKKRILSLLLCGAMLFSLCPQLVLAEGSAQDSGQITAAGGLCEHHTEHDADCGYTEGSEGTPCAHEHSEDCYTYVTECVHEHSEDCYLEEAEDSVSEGDATPSDAEEREPENCLHICGEDSGCITKELNCQHEHDDECGYVPAAEGTPCGYVCEICGTEGGNETAAPSNAEVFTVATVQAMIDDLPNADEITDENAEEVKAQLEAIDEAKAQLSDEEIDELDFSWYMEAAAVVERLLYGAATPSNAVMLADYNGPAIVMGADGISGYAEAGGYHYIYFGTWNDNPVKWRVLDTKTNMDGAAEGGGLFLLSEGLLETNRDFNHGGNTNAWQNSRPWYWCNSFFSNQINGRLTTQEQDAVLPMTKSDRAYTISGTNGAADIEFDASADILNRDRFFFLSAEEAENPNYGVTNGTSSVNSAWWLRSPASDGGVGIVDVFGQVTTSSVDGFLGCRPAFNLDLSAVLFTSAAADGKVSGAVGGGALKSVSLYSGSEWKLTLKDSGRSGFHASATGTTTGQDYPDWTVEITYSGAQTGSNEYVSALLCDSSDNVLCYGNIARGSESGTVSVAMPAGLGVGEYTLKVFSEQCNGDSMTDYASDFVDIPLTVTPDTSAYTLTVDLDGGSGSTESGSYNRDTEIKIDAGTKAGYIFAGWTSSNGGRFADPSKASTTFTMPAANTTITATWLYDSGDTGQAIQLGVGGISGYDSAAESYDYLYFGDWTATDSAAASGPIKWRVLDTKTNTGGSGFFLLSDGLLGTGTDGGVRFNTDPYNNKWRGSAAQSWCEDFYRTYLTQWEQGAVFATNKSDGTYTYTEGGGAYTINFAASNTILDGDRVFFLSAEETDHDAYGFTDDAARVAWYGNSPFWWLRSPDTNSGVGMVGYQGSMISGGADDTDAARPAFNLALSSVLFNSAADGKGDAAVDGNLTEVGAAGTEWKLTLKDDSRSFTARATTSTTVGVGQSLSIEYSGARTGSNEYVSAMLAQDDKILYYGRIAQGSATGTASVTIPQGLLTGSYTLKVFSEQYNGDKMTDLASAFVDIPLTVTGDGTYTLTVALNGGSGSTAGGQYAAGAAIPIDAGTKADHIFAGWRSSNGGSFADSSSASTTFTMPAADTTITATWLNGGDTGQAIQFGTSGISGYDSATNSYDYLYFGDWTAQNSNAASGPIKWRVLDTKTNTKGTGLFLLSDGLLGTGAKGGVLFSTNDKNNVWQGSAAQSWCSDFYNTYLTTREQGAVLATTKSDGQYRTSISGITFAVSDDILSGDRIFFLSAEEADTRAYGFTDDAARIAYYGNGAGYWWLRSPCDDYSGYASVVFNTGNVQSGYVGPYNICAARPAFNLDLNAVLFTSAIGGKEDAAVDGDLIAVGAAGTEWKLTLKDTSRNFSVTSAAAVTAEQGGTVNISYSGAGTGDDEYVSVLLCDSVGKALYYGNIAQGSASGTASVTIPAALAVGNGYTLKVFSEQCNGDKMTDLASAFVDIALTVTTDTTPPTLSNGSATRDSETAATVKFTSSEAGTYYYAVVESGAAAPSDLTISGNCVKGENTISVSGLADAAAKKIYIVAKDMAGNVSVTPLEIEILQYVTPLGTPDNLAWDNSITPGTATWSVVTGASGYSVQLYKDGSAEGVAVSVIGTDHTFTITEAGSYTFKVKATDSSGNHSDSPEAESAALHYYTVTFETNGGSAVTAQIVLDGGKVTEPQAPTKTGYTFMGWYSNSSLADSDKWEFSTSTVSKTMTLYAKWLSADAGVTAVSVDNTEGEIKGDTINVVLPFGTPSLPTDSSAVFITPATGATVSNLTLAENNGSKWTFTVTAEDGTTKANYTMNVSIAPDPAAENKADVAAAKAMLEAHTWTVSQNTANTEEKVKAWIEGQLAEMNLNGASYTVTMTSSSFTAATEGGAADRDGTDGSFAFTVSLSKGADDTLAADMTASINGTITATSYQAQSYTVSVSASPAAGGTVNGGGTYTENTSVTVTASINNGYHFVKWMEGSGEISASASYTFTVTGDRTLVAVFEQDSTPPQTKIVREDLTAVPEGLENTSFDTVEKIKDELTRILTAASGYTTANTAVYDVKLQISTDGGKTWIDATEDNFPASGITVVIPYPSGTGKTTHDFTVTHMFTVTSTKLKTTAGQTEQPPVTKTGDGIRVTLKGLSPVGVAWKTISSGGSSGRGGGLTTYYTLTFETNGGSAIAKATGKSGSTVSLSGYAPTREGYEFTGWYADKDLTDKITSIRLTRNTTIYAGWEKSGAINPDTDAGNPFTDVHKTDWFYDDVMFVYENGLMAGTSGTTFAPYRNTTRAQIAVIFYRLAGSPKVTGECPFTDVKQEPGTLWYYNAVIWAQQSGVMGGYGNNLFGPNDPVTREQLAAIFYNYAKYRGYAVSVGEDTNILSYKDFGQIGEWAIPAIQWAVGSGILNGNGDGVLDPKGIATRAEIAAMLHRFIENTV